jgi:hypothetical protein
MWDALKQLETSVEIADVGSLCRYSNYGGHLQAKLTVIDSLNVAFATRSYSKWKCHEVITVPKLADILCKNRIAVFTLGLYNW